MARLSQILTKSMSLIINSRYRCILALVGVNDRPSVSGNFLYYMSAKIIPTPVGLRFGQFEYTGKYFYKNWKCYVVCKCDCGVIKDVLWQNFKRGRYQSCGCKRITPKPESRKSPIYGVYLKIKSRCYDQKEKAYKNYGGRGVKMCDEWLKDYENFYNWCIQNGWHKGLQVDKDKIGNGLLYSPDTCCLITPKENGRLKKSLKLSEKKAQEIRASRLPRKDLAKIYGVHVNTIKGVINREIWV